MDAKVFQFPSRIKAPVTQEEQTDAAEDVFNLSVGEIHTLAIDAAARVLLKQDPVKYARIDTPTNLIDVAVKAAEILMGVVEELQSDVEDFAKTIHLELPKDDKS